MVSNYRAKFDYLVLKPIWGILLYLSGFSFYHDRWSTGLFLLLMVFPLGYIGASLHQVLSFRELAAGTPTLEEAARHLDLDDVSAEDSLAVTRSCVRLCFMIGLVTVVLLFQSRGWGIAAATGLVVWWLGTILTVCLFALVVRQYAVGRLISIPIGLLVFWSGVLVVVTPIAIFFRAVSQ